MGQICILCAIRQETGPILKRFPSKKVSCFANLNAWRFQAFGHIVTLILSGTGVSNAERAAAEAAAIGPDIIINAGFCGALSPETTLGEVFLAEKLYTYSLGTITAETSPDRELIDLIGTRLKHGTFITTAEIIDKTEIYSLLPDPAQLNVLEMESSAVAAVCRERNIRFIAVRSVSDTADHDPGRLFQQICNSDFTVRTAKVLSSLVKSPSLLAEYLMLYRNSALAGKALSKATASILEHI